MKLRTIIFPFIIFIVAILLFIATIESNNVINTKIAGITGVASKNLFKNPDFKNGLEEWEHTANINLIVTNNLRYVSIDGNLKSRNAIWQNINVISGKHYKLSFKLKGPENGAYVLYKNLENGKKQYKHCNLKNDSETFYWDINTSQSGKYLFYFSANEEGTFCFYDIELSKYNELAKIIYRIVALLLLLIIIFIILNYNCVFTTIILIFMLIPIIKINNEEKSKSENRNLTTYKPLFLKSNKYFKINLNYTVNFNNWINDHFWIRNSILKNQNSLEFLINKRIDNDFAFQGKNGWFFIKSAINSLAKPDEYYEEIYEETALSIKRFNEFCNNIGAKLYIIVAPFSEEIYDTELIGVNLAKRKGRLQPFINKLNDDSGIKILYAYNILYNAKIEGLVEYKTDHHWSKLGAYKAYKELENNIYNDFNITNNINVETKKIINKSKFGFGGTFSRINNIHDSLAKKIYPKDTEYIDYKICDKNLITTEKNNIVFNKSGVNKKIYLFGDSYVQNIVNFFTYNFYCTKFKVKPLQIKMKNFEKEILEFKPDIVVLVVYSRNFDLICNWYK